MGLRLSRHWHKEPSWFDGLDRETQIAVIADWNLLHADPKKLKQRKAAMTSATLQKLRSGAE